LAWAGKDGAASKNAGDSASGSNAEKKNLIEPLLTTEAGATIFRDSAAAKSGETIPLPGRGEIHRGLQRADYFPLDEQAPKFLRSETECAEAAGKLVGALGRYHPHPQRPVCEVAAQFGEELLVTLDGPGHHRGENRMKARYSPRVPIRFGFAAVNGVVDKFKCKKGNAERIKAWIQ
jgi:hypothetical protein